MLIMCTMDTITASSSIECFGLLLLRPHHEKCIMPSLVVGDAPAALDHLHTRRVVLADVDEGPSAVVQQGLCTQKRILYHPLICRPFITYL